MGRGIIKEAPGVCLARFAKMLEYPSAKDKELKRIMDVLSDQGIIEVQQGGFLADNLNHHKVVCIKKPIELDYFRRVVLRRTNFRVGDLTVHTATDKSFRCASCREKIRRGQKYGSKVKRSQVRKRKRSHVYSVTVLCLPCTFVEVGLDELM